MEIYEQYIKDVKSGKILTCEWVKKAVKRHEADLKKAKNESYPYYFDYTEPKRVIKFAAALQHYEGEWAGKPIVFEPWQQFVLSQIYGWRRRDNGTRRYKKAFVFVARKNGKTTLASVLMLYHLFAEPGAQVYSIATKRDQAGISFNNVKQFVARNPTIKKLVNVCYSTISYQKTASKLEALSSESDTMDGLNPSFALADEVAAYKTSKLIDVIQSGMYSRKDPLLLEITTGNDSLNNIGFQEYERSQKVLNGTIEDDSFFCILYAIDSNDDWKNTSKYIKANPSLGVTVTLESLQRARDEAIVAPYKEQEFKVKNLNLFENVSMSWISDKKAVIAAQNYKKYDIANRDLKNVPCVGAIDLSKRFDFTSLTLYWYLEDIDKYVAKHYLYIPSAQIEEKMKGDSMMIRSWINQGLITATPGEVNDYRYLISDLKEAMQKYNIVEVGFDRALSASLLQIADTELPELRLVEIPQTNSVMGPFNVEYEAMVVEEKLCDANPVWRWMLSNATIQVGATGLIHLDKIEDRKSSRRIDCVVTSVMAYNRLKEYRKNAVVIEQISLDAYSY